ncbi:phage tail protein [Arthrobacter russicus]|uniref:Phage-related protein n=1 Tax=Arthrobacter russicus TaxID=172040 RepID=A0ABU1JGT9_9MICC|nr:hypothetical protein [Arthrobacter russicus]MDR6270591.1 phage-related protein [Arthrobacter russicus]
MVTRSAGRVSIRVLPDTRGLRDDLLKALRRIEASMTLKVTTEPVIDNTALLKVKRQIEDISPEVKVDVDAGSASARMALLARTRQSTIKVDLDRASFSAAATALARLSGARVLSNGIQNVRQSLENFDQLALTIGKVVTLGAALSSVLLAASSSAVLLGGGLVQALGAGVALPGILTGMAVGAGVMIAALKDTKTVLADLGPAFKRMQDSISTKFWAEAAAPIRSLASSVLPSLRQGFDEVATAQGRFFAEAANQLKNNLTPAVLGTQFSFLTESINIAKGALAPLVSAMTTLGTVGGAYLPRLAQWFTNLSARFGDYIQAQAASGGLKAFVENGITALSQLKTVIVSVGGILGGLFAGAQAGGGAGLGSLASGLQKVADVANSPAFVNGLATIFRGANAGAAALFSALAPIGNLLVYLGPTISNVLSTVGSTLGQLAAAIASALASPAFAAGLTGLVSGVRAAITGLLPALGPISNALGALGALAGSLLSIIGPVAGQLLAAFAPVVTILAGALSPVLQALSTTVLPILGQAFALVGTFIAQALAALSPLLMMLATSLVPVLKNVGSQILPVVGSMLAAMLPVFGQLVAALSPVIASLVGQLAPIISELVSTLLPPFTQVFMAVVPVLQAVIAAIAPLVAVFASALLPIIQALMPVVQTVFGAIANIITAIMPVIQGVIQVVTGAISGNWSMVWTGIGNIFSGIWNTIGAVVTGVISTIASVIRGGLDLIYSFVSRTLGNIGGFFADTWRNILGGVGNFVAGFIGFFNDLPVKLGIALAKAGSWLFDIGRNIVQGLIDGAGSLLKNLGNFFLDLVPEFIRGPFKQALGIASPSKVFRGYGVNIGEGLVLGVEDMESKIASTMTGLVTVPALPDMSPDVRGVGTGGSGGVNLNLTLNPQPGMSDVTIGQAAARELINAFGGLT